MGKIKDEKLNAAEKNKILDAAIKCFISKGYANCSINDIVGEYGKSKGNIYYYFKNKEEIFVEVLKKWRDEIFETINKEKLRDRKVEDFFGLFIDGFYDFAEHNIKFLKVKIDFLSIAIHHNVIREMQKESYEKWRDVFLIYKKKFKSVDKFEHFIKYFFYVIDGIIIRTLVDNEPLDKKLKNSTKSIILSNLKDQLK